MKNSSLKKTLLVLTAAVVCVAGFTATTMTAFGAPTQSPSDKIYVTPTFQGLNVQNNLEVVGKVFVKELASKDGSPVNLNSDLTINPTNGMIVAGVNGKAALKIASGKEWTGFVPGLIYHYAPANSIYRSLFLWAQNGDVNIGTSSSPNKLIVSGDTDVRGSIKNTSTNKAVKVDDSLEVTGKVSNPKMTPAGCAPTHCWPDTDLPVDIDDGLKVAGAMSVAGDITSQGTYEGGFSIQNFSTGYNPCTIGANSIKKDCQASCSFGDTPIDCGYILQLPANQVAPVTGVNVNALYADVLAGKCNAIISNSTNQEYTVGIRTVCIGK